MKCKILSLLLLFSCAFCEQIEVRLKTASDLKGLYLSMQGDLRSVFEFDLNTGGFATVLKENEHFEKEVGESLFWRKMKIPFVVKALVKEQKLQVTAYNIEKGTSRRYPLVQLSGVLEEDRRHIHKLSDQVHKELFGVEGIASCRLIYSQREEKPGGGFISEIYISDFDGENGERVTFENDYCVSPAFYPLTAGTSDPEFFFVSYKVGQSKIYRSSLQTKTSVDALDLRGSQLLPTVDAKGLQMAFISDAAGRPDLFVNSMGKTRQLFTAPRATQASPTFSPDGRKIAFVSDKDGSARVYLLDQFQTKKNLPLLTKKNRENTSPSWSPDGKKLAYSAKIDGIRQIWIYDFETGEESALTTGPENKENATWAPDSIHLIYNTETNDEGQLYLINLRQREPICVTKGTGQKRFASWETRAK